MNLPIILLSVLALALGTLSVVLALLVGRRYHQINRQNNEILDGFRDSLRALSDRNGWHRDQISTLQEDVARLMSSTGGFWRTALGTTLQVRQMTDSHIANALAHLTETGRENGEGWHNLREEQKRRARDLRMQATTPIQEFNKALMGSPMIVAKGVDTLVEPKTSFVSRDCVQVIDWPQVDKLLHDLIGRTGLSSLNADLHRLRHLLSRGRNVR